MNHYAKGVSDWCAHYMSNYTSKRTLYGFNLLVLMSFEVTTMGSQEPTCCNKSYLLGS